MWYDYHTFDDMWTLIVDPVLWGQMAPLDHIIFIEGYVTHYTKLLYISLLYYLIFI